MPPGLQTVYKACTRHAQGLETKTGGPQTGTLSNVLPQDWGSQDGGPKTAGPKTAGPKTEVLRLDWLRLGEVSKKSVSWAPKG